MAKFIYNNVELINGKSFQTLDGTWYGGQVLDSFSEAELTAIGISKVEEVSVTTEQQWLADVSDVKVKRQQAYQVETDPLFFSYQAGDSDVTRADWIAAREEIRQRYPYPVQPTDS